MAESKSTTGPQQSAVKPAPSTAKADQAAAQAKQPERSHMHSKDANPFAGTDKPENKSAKQ